MSTAQIKALPLETTRFLSDANAFVISSREAIERSAPHIYLSALPAAAQSSLIYQKFTPLLRHLPVVHPSRVTRALPPLLHLRGHSKSVTSVAISAHGNLIATGSQDKTVRVWNALNGVAIGMPLERHSDGVTSVTFSPDGERTASGSDDGTVMVWSATRGSALLPPLIGHEDVVSCVAFSASGDLIASGSSDMTIRIWKSSTGEQLFGPWCGHEEPITSLAFSPNGNRLLSGSEDGTARVWDLRHIDGGASSRLLSDAIDDGHILSVTFSHDSSLLATSSYQAATIRVWDSETCLPIQELCGHEDAVTCVAFFPSDPQIISCSFDQTIRIWDAYSGELLWRPLHAHDDPIMSLALSQDGKRVISSSYDCTARVWDIETLRIPIEPSSFKSDHVDDEAIQSIAWSLDGSRIISGRTDGVVCIWNTTTAEMATLPFRGHDGSVCAVAFSPDGSQAASTGQDGEFSLWDPASRDRLLSIEGSEEAVTSISFSSDGFTVISCSEETVRVRDIRRARELFSVSKRPGRNSYFSSVALSYDRLTLAAGTGDGKIRLFDIRSGKEVELRGHNNDISSISFSHDGRQLVSGSWDHTICVWNLNTKSKQVLVGHDDTVTSVSFSMDGLLVVSGSYDRTVRIWDMRDGAERNSVITGHDGGVTCVALSPDGRYIASGSLDKTIRVWETEACLADPYLLHISASDSYRGWIVGPSDELISWVPPEYRPWLLLPPCKYILAGKLVTIDFRQCLAQGPYWTSCYI